MMHAIHGMQSFVGIVWIRINDSPCDMLLVGRLHVSAERESILRLLALSKLVTGQGQEVLAVL